MKALRRFTGTLILLAVVGACSSDASQRNAAVKVAPPPAGHSDTPAAAAAVTSAKLPFTAPAAWIVQVPKSNMRKAQYTLPRVEGDPEDGELVVYQFPGVAGNIDANIDRWCGQFEQPDGKSSKDVVERAHREVNCVAVTEVALTGRYVAETMPGSGERVNKPGWAMLAAIVETPGDPYFIKLTGPEKTVEHWRAPFEAFVSSVNP